MSAYPVKATAAACLLLLVTAAGCAEKDKVEAQAKKAVGATCPTEIDVKAAQQLPADVPAPTGATVYRNDAQGKTQVWFASLQGVPDDIVKVRDQVASDLAAKGYEIEGKDQEPGAEAEAEFKGPHEGTIQVRTLCQDRLVVRYKLTA